MKKLFFTFFLFPLLASAQNTAPRFENDTLYTSCGYKIYKGMTLQFGKGTKNDGSFRYINIKNAVPEGKLINSTIKVKKLKNFGVSVLGNFYIEIIGSMIFKDGSKGGIDIHIAFENAIKGFAGLPGELIVPEEFKVKQ